MLVRQIITKSLATLLIVVPFVSILGQTTDYPSIQIPQTEIRSLVSLEVAGMTYELHISLPTGYDASDSTLYPVIYYTDAWSFSPQLIGIYQNLSQGFLTEVEALILVGISYPGTRQDFERYRNRDLTPSMVENDYGFIFGGAPSFLAFLEKELFPFIESNYSVEPDRRTYFGHSFGGLFGAWILLGHPELFQKYLLVSPAIWWDDFMVLTEQEPHFFSYTGPPIEVVSIHGSEEPADFKEGFKRWEQYLSNPHFRVVGHISKIIKGESHYSVLAAAYTQGLKMLHGK